MGKRDNKLKISHTDATFDIQLMVDGVCVVEFYLFKTFHINFPMNNVKQFSMTNPRDSNKELTDYWNNLLAMSNIYYTLSNI